MKILKSSVIAVCFAFSSAFSDIVSENSIEAETAIKSNIIFGIRAGGGVNNFSFGYKEADKEVNLGISTGAGLAVIIPLTSRINFNSGLDVYYRELFSGNRDMQEIAVSIPVLLQFKIFWKIYIAAGAQLEFPFATESLSNWNDLACHRYAIGSGPSLELGLMTDLFRFDLKYTVIRGLFEDIEDTYIYIDRSSLMQFGFGITYLF
ncbi:MAG: hypothetical protein FWB90_02630 [Fibromonadales bacterium]|nr:hypothetical protein [Fibromonadales bacterium]